VVLNDEPIDLIPADRPTTVVLDDEATKRGVNTLQIAFEANASTEHDEAFPDQMHKLINDQGVFIEAANQITDKVAWSFAKWEPPAEIDFESVSKSKLNKTGKPSWWKTTFPSPGIRVALDLDCSGLSKGQVYLNGEALGRYFVADVSGKAIEPSMPLCIPSAWLKEDGD
ncbi:unnamed protein product, partial [Laminaria digitata]